jgi:anhydro-N-acetylmuramic acid kinase
VSQARVKARPLVVVGLMSGTSLDGVDAALVRIVRRAGGRAAIKPLASLVRSWPRGLRQRLVDACEGQAVSVAEHAAISLDLARVFASAVEDVLRAARRSTPPDLVASHGHTLCHLPARNTVTVQAGDGALLAELTGTTVASDFRVADTAAGGQGAPLVPFVHHELFSHPRHDRVVQNLGGIGNATLLPAGGDAATVGGSDTGPGNMLIDGCVELLSSGRRRMDKGGRMAARGTVNRELVAQVMRAPFFRRKLPASTGREEFGRHLATGLVESGRQRGLTADDIVASATMATAVAMRRSLSRMGMPDPHELLLCGGGVLNPSLVAMIAEAFPSSQVKSVAGCGADPLMLEAQAFALLGFCLVEGRAAGLPAVTGAAGARVLGRISPGANYRGTLLAPGRRKR